MATNTKSIDIDIVYIQLKVTRFRHERSAKGSEYAAKNGPMMRVSTSPCILYGSNDKVAALEKTIAFPVSPQLLLGDPRLILFLALTTLLCFVDTIFLRKRLYPSE